MSRSSRRIRPTHALILIVALTCGLAACNAAPDRVSSPTTSAASSSPRVVPPGHQTAEILQSYLYADRDRNQQTARIIKTMGVRSGDRIADIGAGSGYFTWHFSRVVGPTGRVWALDTDGEAIFFMQQREKREPFPFANVTLVESRNDSITLPPDSIDWAFFCESHFFLEEQDKNCVRCLKSVFEAVRPGGRLAVIEARSDNVRGEVSKSWLVRPFLTCGFKHVGSYDFLATEYFEIFEKPGRASAQRPPERTGAR